MRKMRRKLDAALKVQVVLEAIRGKRTIIEIASEYGVHPIRRKAMADLKI